MLFSLIVHATSFHVLSRLKDTLPCTFLVVQCTGYIQWMKRVQIRFSTPWKSAAVPCEICLFLGLFCDSAFIPSCLFIPPYGALLLQLIISVGSQGYRNFFCISFLCQVGVSSIINSFLQVSGIGRHLGLTFCSFLSFHVVTVLDYCKG